MNSRKARLPEIIDILAHQVISSQEELSKQLAIRGYIITQATLSISITGNLVVIKTRNGYASGLAYDIDMLESEWVLGTIPGADTVFVAVKENTPRADLFNLFSSFLPQAIMNEARTSFIPDEE